MKDDSRRLLRILSARVVGSVTGTAIVWVLWGPEAARTAAIFSCIMPMSGPTARRLGHEAKASTSEVLHRRGAPCGLPEAAGVLVRTQRWQYAVLGALFGLCAVAYLLLIRVFSLPVAGYLLVVLFALLSALGWHGVSSGGRAVAKADEDGVTKGSLLGAKRVRWDDIAEVGIDTYRNEYGQVVRTECRFRGADGSTLLTLDLSWVPEDDRNRFIEAIRAKQGLPPGTRTELEAAMPPEGRGTELEAAMPPAGRGTEPEAAPAPESRLRG